MSLTPAQCRAARALLDWTQDELAERAEVSRGTIRGFESGQHALQRATAAAVCRALHAGGVILVEADCAAGQGVRFAGPADSAPVSPDGLREQA
jgi:DNA-binding XRE family transcriptional regulator